MLILVTKEEDNEAQEERERKQEQEQEKEVWVLVAQIFKPNSQIFPNTYEVAVIIT